MSITKKPKSVASEPVASAFIGRAPDAAAVPNASPPARKNKVQIAITIAPDLLATVDALAARKGLSRAAAISLACAELVERDAKN
ncbi:hypothetical protein AWB68_07790 [Caballeronia choica]|jgi:hypothetical protein|uniref:CopG family transcriptional regulator n=1 Tax=Caballeronia choica TaxID=326476 RepID=A0A158KXC2_9BURK|nr:hypothetical protein [Caballeronia choica]SAL85747.1 hypothetical protein AWB68_07790 [Caballeronia choica]